MVKYASLLVLFVCFLIIISCAAKQSFITLKPEQEEATPLVYSNVPSFINVPVSIKLKDIENQTNAILTGLIYEDKNIEDDDIEIKIWKQAPIIIQNENNKKIKTILPLKANIKYRVGTQTFGVNLYKTSEFNLNGIVTLTSDIGLTNWQLKTKTELKTLQWTENPSMVVFGKNVPVNYLINPAVNIFKSKIETSIDESIAKSMDFKPNVLAAIEKLTEPFKMSDDYESWLRIIPEEIYVTDAVLKNDNVLMDMGMKCTMETLIGNQPESKFDAKKIVLKPVTKIPDRVTTNIIAISTYNDGAKIISKNFAGEEFASGSKKITIRQVEMWQNNGKMIVALNVIGSVKGMIYLEGIPKYDDLKKEIYFDELDYVVDTKNKLIKTANWLAKGLVLKKIQENCRYSIQPNIDDGTQTILNYLNNYSPMPGVFVNGTMETFEFQNIQLTNNAILAFMKINGKMNVTVDGFK